MSVLERLSGTDTGELSRLEAAERDLKAQQKAVKKDITNKKKRDARLMDKAGKNLSVNQVLQIAAIKAREEEEKQRRKGKGKGKAS